jgi:hypothetical protein
MNTIITLACGVWWCSTHSGIRNEGVSGSCDMAFGDACQFHNLYFMPAVVVATVETET